MRRRSWLLCVLAACGFEGSPGGETAIDAAIVDAPNRDAPDASSPDDRDGDGLDNSADNCPDDANPDQRDHDKDAAGDPCDPCPHLAGSPDLDTDNDQVGDECDPRPLSPGDQRLLWVGFYDQAELVQHFATSGMGWQLVDGKLVQSNDTGIRNTTSLATFSRASLQVGTTKVTIADNGGATNGVFVVSGYRGTFPSIMQGAFCGLVDDFGGALYVERNPMPQGDSMDWPHPLSDVSARMDLNVAANVGCRVVGESTVTRGVPLPDPPELTGTIMLVTQSATASFDYVFAAGVP